MLVIVIDHENSFVGSRTVVNLRTEQEMEAFLRREFPNVAFNDVLFIRDDKIINEWFNRKGSLTLMSGGLDA